MAHPRSSPESASVASPAQNMPGGLAEMSTLVAEGRPSSLSNLIPQEDTAILAGAGSHTQSRTSRARDEYQGLMPCGNTSSRSSRPRSSSKPASTLRQQEHMQHDSFAAFLNLYVHERDSLPPRDTKDPSIAALPSSSSHHLPLDFDDGRQRATRDGTFDEQPANMTDSGATLTVSNKTAIRKAIHWGPNLETIRPSRRDMISSLANVSSSGSYVSRPREPVYQNEDQQPPVSQSLLLSSKDATRGSLLTTDTSDGPLGDPIRDNLRPLLEPRDVPPSHLRLDRSAPISYTATVVRPKPTYLDRLPDELLLEILKLLVRRDELTVLSSWLVKRGGRGWLSPGPWLSITDIIHEPGLVPVVGRGCPWKGCQRISNPGPEVQNILNLRLVDRRWERLVADEFFRSNVMIEHLELTPHMKEACDGAWFVPWCHSNTVENTQIVIRYRVKKEPEEGGDSMRQYEQVLTCSREVLCLGRAPGTWRGWRISKAIHHDQQAFVQSDFETGLQIRGFHFHVTFTDAHWLGVTLTNVVRAFIWALMNCPDEAPMEDGKYLLDLGGM